MALNTQQLSFTISRTINDIAEDDWNGLFGKNLIESYGYQQALEESKLKEFSFGYLIGRRENKPVIILPFFVMDFSFHILTDGLLQKLMRKLKNIFTMRILFFGTPTTEEFYLGVSAAEDLNSLLDGSLNTVFKLCKDEKIGAALFYNLSEKNDLLAGCLAKKYFFRLRSLPTTMIKIKAASLEDYIETLSPNMRKDLKRKLRKSGSAATLKTLVRDNIDGIDKEIYGLYLNNFDGSGIQFETLTREFFVNICRRMPGVAKYFITYDKDRIVAFNLCLIKGDTFIDKFIGFDSKVAHKYHLYFTTFCHNMDFCIKNGIRFYQPGTTDYHPKLRLGAELIPLDIWAKAFNPAVNILIKLATPLIEPINVDPSLKDIEKCGLKSLTSQPAILLR